MTTLRALLVASLAVAFASTGCVDPRENLEAFGERVTGDGDGDGDGDDCTMGLTSAPADLSGRFVVGLELANLAPGAPIRLLADVTYDGDETGGAITVNYVPLDMNGFEVDSERTPGEDAIILTMGTVDENGCFTTAIDDGEVPASANPITMTSIGLTINDLDNVTLSVDGFCGTFEDGISSTGTPLMGNTGAVRVGDDDIGFDLPPITEISFDCAGVESELAEAEGA